MLVGVEGEVNWKEICLRAIAASFQPKMRLCFRGVANSHAHMIDAPSLSQKRVRNRRLSKRTNNEDSYADHA